jgi:DNA processing protein
VTEPATPAHDPQGTDPEDRLADWLLLALTEGVGPVHGRRLLDSTGWAPGRGQPPRWRDLSFAALAAGLGSTRLAVCLTRPDPERDERVSRSLAWLRGGADHHLLTLADPSYPPRLLHLPDAPLVLHVQGDPDWLSHRQLAVVGSRRATPLGIGTARDFAAALALRGWVVTSGLAEGIDRAGHEGALAVATGATVAVMGTGCDRVYPARHGPLADRIRARGTLVTEQPIGMAPLAANFPRRNRLIAALAEGVIVVEAATSSGSLITAQVAAELGRDVFAVPGSIHSPRSRGCHRLLRDGATLVETVDDIVAQFPSTPGTPDIPVTASRASPACASVAGRGGEDSVLFDCLAGGPVDTDRLHATLGWPVGPLLVRLQLLELQGLLGRDDNGDWYRHS